MRLALLLVLVACSAPTRPAPNAPPPAAPPARTPDMDEATVIARSRAFLASIDGRDEATFRKLIGPAFVLFESSRFMNADFLVESMQRGREKQNPPRTRTCKDERVFRGGGAAVYLGDCAEVTPAHGDAAEETWQGWNQVVWTLDGDTWKVAHWGWQKSGIEVERDMWNETFRRTRGMKREPNRHLVATVKGRKPGAALDVAMGQGRNAIYLATQGWKVTGIDISDEGMRIAKATAAEKKVALDAVEADMEKYDFGVAKWDLVTMIYAGDDKQIVERIKPSLKKGGLFVVEYFHATSTTGTAIGGFQTGQLAAQFKGGDWAILVDEVVEDVADWAKGKTKLVRFVAERK